MILLMIAGVVAIAAGLLAILVGVPVKEFSFGNTMILAGSVAICSGFLMIGLGMVVRELRKIAFQMRATSTSEQRDLAGVPLPAGSIAAAGIGAGAETAAADRRQGRADRQATADVQPPGAPWRAENPERQPSRADDDHPPAAALADDGPQQPAKVRRNLLFSSSRKERERTLTRSQERPTFDRGMEATHPDDAPQPHPSFDQAWSRTDADVPRKSRLQSAAAPEQAPRVTIVKSGTVDGMAYSLYSDGSIEAQMPEGMMRFASIDDLRTHLDQRA